MANTSDSENPTPTTGTGASRRTFLKGLGAVTAGGVMATMHGTVVGGSAFASPRDVGNVLVVLSLRGGCDGLSMVVPYGDKHYIQLRPTIAIPPSTLLQTNSMFGLHPNLAPLVPMWKSGKMAAVHAVGSPTPNLSHFSATVAMEEADPDSGDRIGWLNRVVTQLAPDIGYAGTQVGDSVPHTEIYGTQSTLCSVDIDNVAVSGPSNAMTQRLTALDVTWDQASGALGEAARSGLDTAAAWSPVLTIDPNPQNGAQYPLTDLGDAMAQAARVVRSGVGSSVITVDHQGWDMHAGLGTLTTGVMHSMLDELSNAINAFFTDVGPLADNVTLVTMSEFGRRVHENGDAGTDHGWGNVMLVFGGGVKGGYYASWPGLTTKQMTDGNLKVTTDYRSVLWEVLGSRFPSLSLSSVFPSFSPSKVGVMQFSS
jgi:uncharacterized protein (DUF1501 family)